MKISDGEFEVWISVTDVRLYKDDHVTPDRAIVQRTANRLRKRGAVILSVGLTREYLSSSEPKPIHWLQVNNIHLEADSAWQLG